MKNPNYWILLPLLMASTFSSLVDLGFSREFGIVRLKKLGEPLRSNSDVDSIAKFAVDEHNRRSNTFLKFGKVIKAKEQVVAGKMYYLTLEAIDAGKKSVYEAKVWVKPWMNFKQLEEFKRAMDVSLHTTSGLGAMMRDKLGWRKVATHDPEVQGAATYAVTTIQQRSNSLFPYQLLEILQAEAEVVKDYVEYNLLLKLQRGAKEEKLKVLVNKTAAGDFVLLKMEHPVQ